MNTSDPALAHCKYCGRPFQKRMPHHACCSPRCQKLAHIADVVTARKDYNRRFLRRFATFVAA
jgi:hypothetical protein